MADKRMNQDEERIVDDNVMGKATEEDVDEEEFEDVDEFEDEDEGEEDIDES